jgi:hypothetical protein
MYIMMKFTGTLFFLFFFNVSIFLQGMSSDADTFGSDREKSFLQIVQLRGGALIVRLKSQDRKIQAYTKSGNHALVAKLESELLKFNMGLMDAFNNYYDFSAVYFIYPDDYSKVLNGNTSGFFLNNNLEKDSSIVLEQEKFFICEYGPVYAEAIEDQNNARIKVVTSTPVQQDALVIKDTDLQQLITPFPAYVSIRLKTMWKAVENMNSNLHKYYNRVLEKNNG